MIFDSHIHTEFSADAEMKATEALQAAASQGIGLVFTEHLDADYISKEGKEFTFEPETYWREYTPLRGDSLRLGVEIGMRASTRVYSEEFSRRVPFDMVICSQHMVDDLDIFYPDYYADKDKQTAYQRYLVQMADNLLSHSFADTLGHIDYICRYAPYDDADITYKEFPDEIDMVLKTAVDTDTAMEINTRRFGDRQALESLSAIYRRYRELGGRFVTLGSDAHTPAAVGAHLQLAYDFAEGLNLTPVTFHQRQMVNCQK